MRHLSPDHSDPRMRAFTLVEIVVAIGIVTVALIGIFVLLQSALNNYRDAMNSTIASSICQQAVSHWQLADFDKIATLPPQTGFYDERGLPLLGSNTNRAVYVCVSGPSSNLPLNLTSGNLVPVQVRITSPSQPIFQKHLTAMIARLGKETP